MIDLRFVIERIRSRRRLSALVWTWSNAGPSGQDALIVDPEIALDLAQFLREDPELRFDYCSNVTGVDWPDGEAAAAMGEESGSGLRPEGGYLEAVYHLYSVALRHGPLILRLRAGDRENKIRLPSLTPVWKSVELQEREVYDLYGIVFEGHPDLRRILLWDEFEGHPMRKDFVAQDEAPSTAAEAPGEGGAR